MSEHAGNVRSPRAWIVPMRPRAPDEPHRTSTPLELLFDLVFVVAVAQAASSLHHGIADAHAFQSIGRYGMVFFAIWWAWMNFTWFASAYDTDDVPYRLAVFVQLAGALILAAGVPRAFDAQDFGIVTAGYVVMRLSLVVQWLRAARADAQHRTTAHRYVIGITVVQAGWVALLFMPAALRTVGFFVLVAAELVVPVWAERAAITSWHPGHIAERYGLFTIIVLGESVLSASLAMQAVIQADAVNADVLAIIVGGVLIVLSMWWLYFDQPEQDIHASLRTTFTWAYGHLVIFPAAAAVGAGLAVAVDHATEHAEIGTIGAGAAVAVPVALYLLSLWALHHSQQTKPGSQSFLFPVVAVLVLLSSVLGQAVLVTGMLLVGLIAVKLVRSHRQRRYVST